MRGPDQPERGPTLPPPSAFTTPTERTRPWSADEVEVALDDPAVDLACDDTHRLEEDAHPEAD